MTSAAERPVGGRDTGRFSTLTARAGRSGTRSPGASAPVNGQIVGGVGIGELVTRADWSDDACLKQAALATPTARVSTAEVILPRPGIGTDVSSPGRLRHGGDPRRTLEESSSVQVANATWMR